MPKRFGERRGSLELFIQNESGGASDRIALVSAVLISNRAAKRGQQNGIARRARGLPPNSGISAPMQDALTGGGNWLFYLLIKAQPADDIA